MSRTFEMLWDCSSCGTAKLLGKSHRRCPQCGAPQDPRRRYFPPPGEEVEAVGHVFVGVDWSCVACETPNSKAALFCVNCGNGRDGGNADVARLADRVPGTPGVNVLSSRGPRASIEPRRRVLPFVIGGAVVVAVAMLLVTIFWQKDVFVSVEQHTWTREIDVERFGERRDSSWCDSMPIDGYNVSRSREVRSHRQIPDGQTCTDRHVDNGDGTYSTRQDCKTKYRSEPVYDDKCRYSVNRWDRARTERATGRGLVPAPTWPRVSLARTGTCMGCEREGARREDLVLGLRNIAKASDIWMCTVDDARWRRLTDGARAQMRVRVITGGAVCSTLR